ncbi:GntR family transcriptional regulator [Desulfitobacterium chlororespirans]|uniref:Transcriptional regulator, GntR family n=1 Tax=Desulfitobacterium chlororespirans DSM 11544 TaxID=1121395 RepID=A0A1M7S4P6_9FIRM|nr:GntR family transcriptional regulator [Desulfitobacterium chlororespirans]SHN53607.1 transcriptional regulator, GntR family [Desulfitobacterium chlororespirans DSM 11544]
MSAITKSLPFHLQIYEILKGKILNGEISRGERLYENKISQELGVSRSPVREALRMLEQDELVVVTSTGLVVNPMEFSDMEEIYQCRMALEPFAAKISADKLTNEDLDTLRNLVTQARVYHNQKAYEKVVESNTQFHDIIIQSSGNSRLIGIIEKIRSLIILSRKTEFECYQREGDYLDEHEGVLAALTQRNGDEAERLLRTHIMNDFEFYSLAYEKVLKN